MMEVSEFLKDVVCFVARILVKYLYKSHLPTAPCCHLDRTQRSGVTRDPQRTNRCLSMGISHPQKADFDMTVFCFWSCGVVLVKYLFSDKVTNSQFLDLRNANPD
jgi:hypothetical protein